LFEELSVKMNNIMLKMEKVVWANLFEQLL